MIQNRELKQQAEGKLRSAPQHKKLSLYYAGILCVISVVFMLADQLISMVFPETGGLSTIGLRSFLSTLSSILPIVSFILSMCLSFGFLGGMVRVSRGQYTSPNALRTGFERFFPLLRLTALKALIITGLSIGATYLTSLIYTLSPLSDSLVEALTPALSSGSLLSEGTLTLDPATIEAIYAATPAMLAIFLAVMLVFGVPMLYRLRLADYVLYDHPETGALYALRQSRLMMRGNRWAMFQLDLSFWWYYLLLAAAAVVAYGDVVLSLLGVSLPLSGTVSYFLFFALSLIADFAVYYFALAKVEVTYAGAYDAIVPRQQPTDGVVLGNIFDLAKQQGDL